MNRPPPINRDRHQHLLARLLAEAKRQPYVTGVMLLGSVARGDHHPGSDLDLLVLVGEGHARGLAAEEINGILVERHYHDEESLLARAERRPMLAHGLTEGRVLHDPQGRLTELVVHARRLLAEYQTPSAYQEEIRYWLYTTRIKLLAAIDAGNDRKAALHAATRTWKLLEGLWAINDLPMTHGGAVLSSLDNLTVRPDDLTGQIDRLLLGNTRDRANASLFLIDWLLAHLSKTE